MSLKCRGGSENPTFKEAFAKVVIKRQMKIVFKHLYFFYVTKVIFIRKKAVKNW